MAKASRTIKKVIGQDEKRLEDVVPEIIKIMAEGDVTDRVANFLYAQGWTENDVWRELVQKRGYTGWFSTNLRNDMRDAERSGLAIGSKWRSEIDTFKHLVKE